MITLNNKSKSINITSANDITVIGRYCYKVNVPTITCNTEKDAVKIQMEINEFVNKLGRQVINEN